MNPGKNYTKIDDIRAYQLANDLGEIVWDSVIRWEWFAKKIVGSQFVESSDSISANIAEGFGRYHKKDKIKFYLNARGSIYESADWAKKSLKRKLLTEEGFATIIKLLRRLPKEINYLIKVTKENLKV